MAGKEVLSKSEIDALKKEWLAEMKANMKVKYLRKRGSICICLCALKDLIAMVLFYSIAPCKPRKGLYIL